MPATTSRAQSAEERLLDLLAQSGVPAPDEIQESAGQLRALWHDQKIAVVIDLDPGMPR